MFIQTAAEYMDLKTNTYVELYYKGTIPLRVIFFSGKRGIMISEFERMWVGQGRPTYLSAGAGMAFLMPLTTKKNHHGELWKNSQISGTLHEKCNFHALDNIQI